MLNFIGKHKHLGINVKVTLISESVRSHLDNGLYPWNCVCIFTVLLHLIVKEGHVSPDVM